MAPSTVRKNSSIKRNDLHSAEFLLCVHFEQSWNLCRFGISSTGAMDKSALDSLMIFIHREEELGSVDVSYDIKL